MDQFNPEMIEIKPGVTIASIRDDLEALHLAVTGLEFDVADIKAQLVGAVTVPQASDPDWRRRAEAALRVKVKALALVRARLGALRRQKQAANAAAAAQRQQYPRPDREKRAQVLLDTIRDELGDAEFDRLRDVAKGRYPQLFGVLL